MGKLVRYSNTFSFLYTLDIVTICRKRAEDSFNKDDRFADYIKLYEKIIG